MPPKERKNKPQLRTTETLAKILDAGEAVFSEQGFEMTQLEEIAARAGYSRGAIYAHFANKEDLFLAIMEERVLAKFAHMRAWIEREVPSSERLENFRQWLSEQIFDQRWGLLMLEFKLYALRRPSSFDKLRNLYDKMVNSSGRDFMGLLAGEGVTEAGWARLERRLSVAGAVLSAVVLETHFRPHLFPEQARKQIFDELTRELLHT